MAQLARTPSTSPVLSFLQTFQGAIGAIEPAHLAVTLETVNRALAASASEQERAVPLSQLSEIATEAMVERLLDNPMALDEVREALGIGVPALIPIVQRARCETKRQGLERQLFEIADSLQEVIKGDNLGKVKRQVEPYKGRPQAGHYSRTWVYWEKGVIEVLLLRWSPGAKTPIHDHADSWGVDAVLDGKMLEHSYDLPRGGDPIFRGRRMYNPGDVIALSGAMLHSAENPSRFEQDLFTIHIYYPPIEMGRVLYFE